MPDSMVRECPKSTTEASAKGIQEDGTSAERKRKIGYFTKYKGHVYSGTNNVQHAFVTVFM